MPLSSTMSSPSAASRIGVAIAIVELRNASIICVSRGQLSQIFKTSTFQWHPLFLRLMPLESGRSRCCVHGTKECPFDNETRCEEIRHQDRGVMGMWSKARVLSAVVGLSLLGVSSGAVAAIHFDVRSNQSAPLSQMASPGSRTIVADWNEYQWRHHHHPSN